jgi:hypothetical protein
VTANSSSRLAWTIVAATALMSVVSLVLLGPTPPGGAVSSSDPAWLVWLDNILSAVVYLAFGAVGAVILSRRPGNTIGLLLVGIGLCAGVALTADAYVSADATSPGAPWAAWIGGWVGSTAMAGLPLVLLLFPDGRLISKGWRVVAWLTVVAVALIAIGGSFSPGHLQYGVRNPLSFEVFRNDLVYQGGIGWPLLLICVAASATSMIIRFRRTVGERRQQMKWFTFAAAVFAAGFIIQAFSSGETISALEEIVLFLGFLALPLGMGAAILRYRLYDIDLIINRTLVYGSLTAVLGLIYFGLVVIFQRAMQPLTAQSDLAVAISTLLVAALFRPARRRIQSFIDRRFYRAKYDASKTLEAFAARQREVVNLDALQGELLGVVSQTMQPVHASVWLRDVEARR